MLEERHNAFLADQFEDLLTTRVAEMSNAVTQAAAIITEIQAAHKRESAAVDAVREAWRGTEGMKRRVVRNSSPLDEFDRLLAGDWAARLPREHLLGRRNGMARCAELVALDIYREIYGEVEDLSILQKVAQADTRWKAADIDAAGRWIDVKNARRSFSSPNSYSEHCVKYFKSDQGNCPVVVSGFLSPYCTDDGRGMEEQVIWLGETTIEIIKSLKDQFETDYLHLNLSSNWATRIPPWLFEYPPECYAERDRALRVWALAWLHSAQI